MGWEISQHVTPIKPTCQPERPQADGQGDGGDLGQLSTPTTWMIHEAFLRAGTPVLFQWKEAGDSESMRCP